MSKVMKMGVVADDITGSNDIGIMFAKSDYLTHVYPYNKAGDFRRQWQDDPDVVILDTNSRLDEAKTAYDKVYAAAEELKEAGCTQFFNKTCSVFRGNIGAEFDAMLDALGQEFGLVVLGFPKNGRTTIDGVHYVRGVPLAESEFQNDPIHPMTRSDLVEILGSQTKRTVKSLNRRALKRGAAVLRAVIEEIRPTCNYLILDVEDQDSLKTIARAVHDMPVICGSSALAEELPAVWGPAAERGESEALPKPNGAGVLCAAGSLMPQTAAQIEHLRERGATLFALDAVSLFDEIEGQRHLDQLAASISQALGQGQDVLLHTPNDPAAVSQMREMGKARRMSRNKVGRLVSGAIAAVVAQVVGESGQNRLAIAGGETSAAVCERLGVQGLRVWKEIQPGLPSCLTLTEPGLLLVLKSGSFGTPAFLEQAIAHLKSQ